jgi:hypothetical protein
VKSEAEQDLEYANITLAVLFIPGMLWEAFVICKLWAWFVVPLGVPPLWFFQATGLSILTGMLFHRTTPRPKTPEDDAALTWRLCENLIWMPVVAIAFGWVAHVLMR